MTSKVYYKDIATPKKRKEVDDHVANSEQHLAMCKKILKVKRKRDKKMVVKNTQLEFIFTNTRNAYNYTCTGSSDIVGATDKLFEWPHRPPFSYNDLKNSKSLSVGSI